MVVNHNSNEADKNPDLVSTNEPAQTVLIPTFDEQDQTQAEPIHDNLAGANCVPTAAESNISPEK